MSTPLTVGWLEHVAFPDWGIARVKAKIDTGARTSALDVVSYELRQADGGIMVAELRLALDRRHPKRMRVIHAPVSALVMVRNTGGLCEQRPLIETTLRLGALTKNVRFTITNRSHMRFPVILGRTALAGDCIVDVGRKYVLGRKT